MSTSSSTKRKRGVILDGFLQDPLDKRLPTVADLWDFLLNLYALKERDHTYAYRGPESFARINQLYTAAKHTKCRFVLLIHAHHQSLRKYLKVAESFLDKYGLVIISLTWFCANDDTSNDAKRALENELANQTAEMTTTTATVDEREQANEVDDGMTSTSVLDDEDRALDEEVRRIMFDDNDSDSDQTIIVENDEATVATAEMAAEEERFDKSLTLDAVATLRPNQITRNGDSTGRHVGNCVYMRNTMLARFFAELILYIRHITVYDTIGVVQHKSYRVLHQYSLNRWYKDITNK